MWLPFCRHTPLQHLPPAQKTPHGLDDDALDLLFQALASQPRRAILEVIRQHPGCNVLSVSAQFPFSRIAVLKHLSVLEAANLVISRKHGRERCLWFNAVPLQQVHELWTDQFDRYWSSGLLTLKRSVETGEPRVAGSKGTPNESHIDQQDSQQKQGRETV